MDRPILFSGPMVRAILEGRKTQTRRVLNKQTSLFDGGKWPRHLQVMDWRSAFVDDGPSPAGNAGPYLHVPWPVKCTTHRIYPRIQVGDRMWVRETWATWMISPSMPKIGGQLSRDPDDWCYRATDDDWNDLQHDKKSLAKYNADRAKRSGNWVTRPSIHMPRWASRLTLTVTDVRVQRVQEISEEDAWAEGVGNVPHDHRDAFAFLWEDLNAKRGYGWDVNPWVVAVTFTAEHRNIDEGAG